MADLHDMDKYINDALNKVLRIWDSADVWELNAVLKFHMSHHWLGWYYLNVPILDK